MPEIGKPSVLSQRDVLAVFFIFCPDLQSCPANAIQIVWETWDNLGNSKEIPPQFTKMQHTFTLLKVFTQWLIQCL